MLVDTGKPICGRDSRLSWLETELAHQLEKPTACLVTRQDIVGWFLRYGRSLGFSHEELVFSLKRDDNLSQIAKHLDEKDILAGKPPPDFSPGQSVEVVLNARNTTYRRGSIADVLWHHENGLWHYWIAESGKRVSRRYEARDLRLIDTSSIA